MKKETTGTVSYTGNKSISYVDTICFAGFLWGLIVMGIILNIIIVLVK